MIVPVGNIVMQAIQTDAPNFARQVLEGIKERIPSFIAQIMNGYLDAEVTEFLGREHYQRRRHAKSKETTTMCSKCHSRERQKFRRDGHYRRNLATCYGQVQIGVPQIECECGGKVRYAFKTIRARQRFWVDVQTFVQTASARGQSYRQIKSELDERLCSSVGLRTLNRQVLPLGSKTSDCQVWEKGFAPPVVRVDGIWLTVMFETGKVERDKAGRLRPIKRGKKIPILAAQGVWPATGETRLIAWMRADGEDEKSWQIFLEMLWEAGLTPENGLKMLVSDGGLGFEAAYQNVYWSVWRQRCVFHKLKNVARALKFSNEIDRAAKKEFSTSFLRSAAQIWQAENKTQALHLYNTFCTTWLEQQPKAIKTLQRDFEATLTFYEALEYAETLGQSWPAHLLRTTSPLERMFREFRRRFRQAILFHSTTGAQAATAQLAARFS
jgi:transposase-like protein